MKFVGERILVTPPRGTSLMQQNFSSFVMYQKTRNTVMIKKPISETAAEQAQKQTRLEKEKKDMYATALAKVIAAWGLPSADVLDESVVEKLWEMLESQSLELERFTIEKNATMRAAKYGKTLLQKDKRSNLLQKQQLKFRNYFVGKKYVTK